VPGRQRIQMIRHLIAERQRQPENSSQDKKTICWSTCTTPRAVIHCVIQQSIVRCTLEIGATHAHVAVCHFEVFALLSTPKRTGTGRFLHFAGSAENRVEVHKLLSLRSTYTQTRTSIGLWVNDGAI